MIVGGGKKVLVTGSRDWTDAAKIKARLEELPPDTIVIAGGARGADEIARDAAMSLGMHCAEVKANWRSYKSDAGMLRNRVMLALEPDLVLAFPLAQSRGTLGCIAEAEKLDIPVEVIE